MNETPITLVLRLRLDRDCPEGTITTDAGVRREFAGRLGLIGAIDDLLTQGGEASPAPTDPPSPKEPS